MNSINFFYFAVLKFATDERIVRIESLLLRFLEVSYKYKKGLSKKT